MKNNLAAYELMAIGVAALLFDHAAYYFYPDELWFRIMRMFALVWFIPLGYNAGHKVTQRMWQGAIGLVVLDKALGFEVFPMCAMSTIVAVRLVINPVAELAVRSKTSFYAVNFLLLGLIPFSQMVMDYGTVALIIAMGGWLLKNRDRVEGRIVSVKAYFVFLIAVYLVQSYVAFEFNLWQSMAVVISTALTAAVMYDFRTLILNDLRRKSTDIVSRACRFIGHKSLEIYILQWILLKVLLVIALMP